MRILHISWEFPPVMYGGLGRHVKALATAQAAAGHDVTVLTQDSEDSRDRDDEQLTDGVRVVRARERGQAQERTIDNLIPWVESMQRAMVTRSRPLIDSWRPDVVHAHDWVVGDAARAVRRLSGAPLMATVHATEAGRHQGWIVGPLSHEVHAREWRLVHGADDVIVCSNAMRDEVTTAFGGLDTEPNVIPNGVDLRAWRVTPAQRERARQRWAADGLPLVVCSGRLVWEKGMQTLIDAIPEIRKRHPGTRALVAGRGPLEGELRQRIRDRNVGTAVDLLGFLPEEELRTLVSAGDCAVVPSVYEPFGLVAAEAAALGTPVVASNTGGLADVIVHGRTGRLVTPQDAHSLAEGVSQILDDPEAARRSARRDRARLARLYSWPIIARSTVEAYRATLERPVRTSTPRAPHLGDVNVLTGEHTG